MNNPYLDFAAAQLRAPLLQLGAQPGDAVGQWTAFRGRALGQKSQDSVAELRPGENPLRELKFPSNYELLNVSLFNLCVKTALFGYEEDVTNTELI